MALSVIQTSATGTTSISGTTVAKTWASNTTTGNLLIALIAGGVQHVSSIADSQTNTWVVADAGNFSWSMCEIWYCKNATGGVTPTVTATFAAAEPGTIHLIEVSGADTGSPLDKTAHASGDGVTPNTPTVTTAATTTNDEIVVAISAVFLGSGTDLPTVGAGYSNFVSTNSTPTTGITVSSGSESKIVSATGAQTATFGLASASGFWETTVATFKQAAAGATPTNLFFFGS